PAVRGDRDGERSWGMGELDPPGDSRYSRRGHELDAIEIVAGAERRRRVAGALLRDGQPGEDRAEEESSGARPHCGGRMAARTRRAITESGRISDLASPRRLSGARQYVSRSRPRTQAADIRRPAATSPSPGGTGPRPSR